MFHFQFERNLSRKFYRFYFFSYSFFKKKEKNTFNFPIGGFIILPPKFGGNEKYRGKKQEKGRDYRIKGEERLRVKEAVILA